MVQRSLTWTNGKKWKENSECVISRIRYREYFKFILSTCHKYIIVVFLSNDKNAFNFLHLPIWNYHSIIEQNQIKFVPIQCNNLQTLNSFEMFPFNSLFEIVQHSKTHETSHRENSFTAIGVKIGSIRDTVNKGTGLNNL